MATDRRAEIQGQLETIVEKLKNLRRKKGKITEEWIGHAKNPLMGYAYLFGEKSLKELGKPKEQWSELDGVNLCYREYYFRDIKYRSKLRKIRDKISYFEQQYHDKLFTLKDIVLS